MRTRSASDPLRRAILTFVASVVAFLPASMLHAASVPPMSFDAVVDGAATAFQGRCTDNRSELDVATGMIVTITTFEVEDALKGPVGTGATHVIKQVGGRAGNVVTKIDGIPSFAPGNRYVVFLYGVSSAGFSSPVGLGQGSFEILQGARGSEVANGRDFRTMLAGSASVAMPDTVRQQLLQAAGPVERLELESFKALVRQRTGLRQGAGR